MWTLRTILTRYEKASGQMINIDKSALFFSPNVNLDFRSVISNLIGMLVVENLGRYLGVPTKFTRKKRDDFRDIKQRVWQTLQGWKHKYFSVDGKEVLIKSVAQSIPTYIMSCFRLPKTLCDDMHYMMARFWWGSTETKRRIHWKK